MQQITSTSRASKAENGEPTPVQKQFLRAFLSLAGEIGKTPSLQEIGERMGYSGTPSRAWEIKESLVVAGILRCVRGRSRSYEIAVPKKLLRRWLRD